jgi:photosystem II stability/assembly factor-like uncharacterized protein
MQIRHPLLFAALVALLLTIPAFGQADPSAYATLNWRLIGPFRAGRVTAVSGVLSDPSIYYAATPNGGIWKTTDGGRVWRPVFDAEHVASIGAVAVAPSQPDTVYAGTGEQGRGNGVYKSTDAGATWAAIGLADTHFITNLIVDPRNPELVLVSASGDFEPGPNRGVFRTTNGGRTWSRVLFRDNNTGAVDVCFNPDNPREVFAALERRPPQGGEKPPAGLDAWIYRSRDEGATWQLAPGEGLPEKDRGRIGVAVAPANRGQRVFAIMTQGLFRSDNGGNSWRQITTDPRVIGNGYFSRVFVDPRNPDTVYVAQTSMYRSTDGGSTFQAWNGAPSGDDVHVLWINPRDTRLMILGVDQGAIVSRDGGQSWSSWFNQPTGQFYTVTTDDQFPYWIYAAQQDSGTVATPSCSDFGELTYRDWYSTGGFEVAHILADPLDPNKIYSSGWYGTLMRLDRRSGQMVHVFVPGEKYRTWVMPPIAFSPQDPHTLYLGAQEVLATGDGGMNWHELSPDLTRGGSKKPAPQRRPVNRLTALAPSPVQAGVLWVGSGDGLIHVTRDGGTNWQNVTPPAPAAKTSAKGNQEEPAYPLVVEIEASHHDAGTAYAVLQVPREFKPYVLRTHDFGHTWSNTVQGLPADSVAWALREDDRRKGLLYAGTETGVFLSFDDGEHWQSLQLNLPVSPVRDLAVHGNDLVAATFGRALWSLDDVTPLRRLTPEVTGLSVHLFPPADTVRVRWDENPDTPLPPEMPAGANPHDGAIIDYWLKSASPASITLAVYDVQNHLVRRFSSTPEPPPPQPANAPEYWFGPQPALSAHGGLNRFVWDLRYAHPAALTYGYFGKHLDYFEYTLPDHAIPGHTPRYQPQGPLVMPGQYQVVLSVNGQEYRQPLTVRSDPRISASEADLRAQLALEQKLAQAMDVSYQAWEQVHAARTALAEDRKSLTAKDALDSVKKLDDALGALEDGDPQRLGFGPLNRDLGRLLTMAGSGDARPAQTLYAAAQEGCANLNQALTRWQDLSQHDFVSFNALLQKAGKPELPGAKMLAAGCTP